jgi:hypothetical protein
MHGRCNKVIEPYVLIDVCVERNVGMVVVLRLER